MTKVTTEVGHRQSCIDTPDLYLSWSEAVWDTVIFEYPVLQIDKIEVRGSAALDDFARFHELRRDMGSRLVSCRLDSRALRESFLLESAGFKFIEMIFHPEISLAGKICAENNEIQISMAAKSDLDEISEIAGIIFYDGRYKIDLRIPQDISDRRYAQWARNAYEHEFQRLYVMKSAESIIGFFVTEMLADMTMYWHLNGISSKFHGKGYGMRCWAAMLDKARHDGAKSVKSSISARNYKVINLYAKLGFKLPNPLMTFHWVGAD